MPTTYEDLKTGAGAQASAWASFFGRQLDRVVSPSTRAESYDRAYAFAMAKPLIFSFLVSQLIFSFLPLFLFAAFVASVVAFALGAALVFTLFWIGVAMLFLVPTLFLTFAIGVLVWMWAVSSLVVSRWLYGFVMGPGDKAVVVSEKGKNSNGVDMAN